MFPHILLAVHLKKTKKKTNFLMNTFKDIAFSEKQVYGITNVLANFIFF